MNHILQEYTGPELVDIYHSIESQEPQAQVLREAIIETLSTEHPKYLVYVGVIQEREAS